MAAAATGDWTGAFSDGACLAEFVSGDGLRRRGGGFSKFVDLKIKLKQLDRSDKESNSDTNFELPKAISQKKELTTGKPTQQTTSDKLQTPVSANPKKGRTARGSLPPSTTRQQPEKG
ncbi:cytochrome c oxidase biogenesis protein Cmc1-like [Striga asiatica]|uniref:Cytochrome c oxidase biogenesis protein Cmc1-like n=1 Tax=Striga asiatica TaxID=4170 RepID=A0A5A7RE55_STRAF|nr:cytochrome c oxidase biogenesis protein Cmc1-like [Striga asiatica]